MFLKYVRKKKNIPSNIRVCNAMRDYSKEDFFIKKLEAARIAIIKWGLPKELYVK